MNNFDYTKYPNKLNLGCGFDIRTGYINVDVNAFHNPDLIADVCDLSMLPSSYYEEIIAYDVLEHLTRNKAKIALAQWNRLLKTNGKLKLQVPNILGLLSLFNTHKYKSIEKQEELIRALFGTQEYNGDFHYNGFTEPLLSNYLLETGFINIKVTNKDEWLFVAEAEKIKNTDFAELVRRIASIVDDKEFLETAYISILGRMPESTVYDYLLFRLYNKEIDKIGIIGNLLNSPERKNISYCTFMLGEIIFIQDNVEFLDIIYDVLLQRKPDIEGYNFFLNKLEKAELNKREVIINFINCDERKKIIESIPSIS